MIISRRIRWRGGCDTIGRGGVNTGCWWGDLMERVDLEDLGVDGRIILN
jgi:hypothetical protein